MKERTNKMKRLLLGAIAVICIVLLGCTGYGIVDAGDPLRVVSLIMDENIASASIKLEYMKTKYSGDAYTPEVSITYEDEELIEGQDYTLDYTHNVNAGDAYIIVKGIGDYRDDIAIPFIIEKTDNPFALDTKEIDVTINESMDLNTALGIDNEVDGTGDIFFETQTPDHLQVSKYGVLNSTNPGTAYVAVTAAGDDNHEEKTEIVKVNVRCLNHEYERCITPATILVDGQITKVCTLCGEEELVKVLHSPDYIVLSKTSYVYNGKDHRPKVKVFNTNGGRISHKYFDVVYEDSTSDVGEYAVTVDFKTRYSAQIKESYEVKKADQKIILRKAQYNKTMASSSFSAGATLKKGDGKLTYTSSDTSVAEISKKGNITVYDAGYTKIKVTAAATKNYKKTTRTIKVKVKPNKVSNVDIESNDDDGSMELSWQSQYNVSGYQIFYSKSSDFSTGRKVKVSGSYKTISGLSKGVRYYAKVRSYSLHNGKTYYGEWSNRQSVVTKKPAPVRSYSSSTSSYGDGGGDVLVTPTGSCYHNHVCGRGNYYWTSYANAIARGLRACKKCY